MRKITGCMEGTRTITFPRSVRKVDEDAFNDVKSLISVATNREVGSLEGSKMVERYPAKCGWYDYVTEIDSPFKNSSVKEIRLAPGLWRLGGWTFYELSALKTAYLPEGLRMIGAGCF